MDDERTNERAGPPHLVYPSLLLFWRFPPPTQRKEEGVEQSNQTMKWKVKTNPDIMKWNCRVLSFCPLFVRCLVGFSIPEPGLPRLR